MHLQITTIAAGSPRPGASQLQVVDDDRVLLVSAPLERIDALALATTLRLQARTGELSVSCAAVTGGHEARLRDHAGSVVLRSATPTSAATAAADAAAALDAFGRLPLRAVA